MRKTKLTLVTILAFFAAIGLGFATFVYGNDGDTIENGSITVTADDIASRSVVVTGADDLEFAFNAVDGVPITSDSADLINGTVAVSQQFTVVVTDTTGTLLLKVASNYSNSSIKLNDFVEEKVYFSEDGDFSGEIEVWDTDWNNGLTTIHVMIAYIWAHYPETPVAAGSLATAATAADNNLVITLSFE